MYLNPILSDEAIPGIHDSRAFTKYISLPGDPWGPHLCPGSTYQKDMRTDNGTYGSYVHKEVGVPLEYCDFPLELSELPFACLY